VRYPFLRLAAYQTYGWKSRTGYHLRRKT